MAKQRKKKNKKQEQRLAPKEKKKYSILVAVPLSILFLLFLNSESIYCLVLKTIYPNHPVFTEPDIGFFLILTSVLFVIGLIIILSWYDSAIRLALSFSDYFLNKIPKAKKQIKHHAVTLIVWFVLITGAFWLSTASCTVADDNAIVKYNLFKQDAILCDYADIDNAKVYTEYEYFSMAGRFVANPGGYHIRVEIKSNDFSYVFNEEFFSRDFTNVEKFLSNIESEKIVVDKTDYEKINVRGAENKAALNRIFDLG